MKVPLRYQNTEYDCGTTTFVNALAYLYDREDIPVELLKAIYKFTLDARDSEGIIGQGGTSSKHAKLLADFFVKYTKEHDFKINCEILSGENITVKNLNKFLGKNGVAIARCWQQNTEHYVLITKIADDFVYIFDPYYLEKDYYITDDDVAMVFHEEFTHNRIVKTARLFAESRKDYSLLEGSKRSVIVLS